MEKTAAIELLPCDDDREFAGIGGITSNGMSKLLMDYPEAIRDEILNLLFKPDYGASLQHLKVEIGSDVNTSSGTEPSHKRSRDDFDITRGYGLMIARMAKDINPELYLDALRWGTPAWIQNDEDKYLYYLKFLQGAREVFGLEFDYLGPDINEGAFDRNWVVNTLRPGLDRDGFAHIRLVADDSDQGWDIAYRIRNDKALSDAIYALAVHYRQDSPDAAKQSGKPLWLSEDLAPFRHSFTDGALDVAMRIIRMYVLGRMVKYELHPLIESQYETTPFHHKSIVTASWPWSGHYEISPGLWVIAQFTHFIKPGWKFINKGCGLTEHGGYISLYDPNTEHFSTVIVNNSREPVKYRLYPRMRWKAPVELSAWATSEKMHLCQLESAAWKDSCYEMEIAPFSVYTLTTLKKNKAPVRPPEIQDRRFPLPYRDDFASYKPGQLPKYMSDQGGAFEAENDGSDHWLEQKIDKTMKPIDWTYRKTPEPYTLIGSLEWADYSVRIEAQTPAPGEYVMLGGRVNYTEKGDACPEGYLFTVNGNGQWKLSAGARTLIQGVLPAEVMEQPWLALKLEMEGHRIRACVNGITAGTAADSALPSGQAVLGSSYHRARFRRLEIVPAAGYESCQRYTVHDPKVFFGGRWKAEEGNYNAFGRTEKVSSSSGDRLVCRFEGTGISILGRMAPICGMGDVFLNGKFAGRINAFSETVLYRKALFSVRDLPFGEHVLELITAGEKDQRSRSCHIFINAIETVGGSGLL